MKIFDLICIGTLIVFAGGYVWFRLTSHFAPPSDEE